MLTSGHCAYDSELAKLLTQRMTFQPGARVDAQTGKVTGICRLLPLTYNEIASKTGLIATALQDRPRAVSSSISWIIFPGKLL